MRGRFWRKVIIKRGNNVAFPETNDSFRTTENRPGIKYDPAKKTTLFAEDLKALGDSIISVQNAIGNFDLDDRGTIIDYLDQCVTKSAFHIHNLNWDATIKQIGTDLEIPALTSRALFANGFVKLEAFYKAPYVALLNNLYMELPMYVLHSNVNEDTYFFDALQFQYKFKNDVLQYFGHGLARLSAKQNQFIFLYYHEPVTGRNSKNPSIVTDRQINSNTDCYFIKDSIIKFQMEYLTNA